VEEFANHTVATEVTEHEFDLSDPLLNEEGAKI
jgi:hypothetical protein